jgi:sulfur-oxidizing protein SoxX
MNGPLLRAAVLGGLLACMAMAQVQAAPAYRVVGDAIAAPLTTQPGDATRGRAIVVNRQVGLCLLCHSGSLPEERFQGNLAPTLDGAGSRWSEGQLRLRLVDARALNPNSIMPAYFQTDGLTRVAPAVQGKPLLNAQQIEDVVAFLRTLTTPPSNAP